MDEAITKFSGKYSFLSNFYPVVIMYDGLFFPTVEHAYQAAKTTNIIQRMDFQNMVTPGEAKRYGKRVRLREDWEQVKQLVMFELLTKKFARPELRKMLVDTGTAELIEGNTWGDTYWGICNGKGANLLGKFLMQIRFQIQYGLCATTQGN